jgi:hypothetical protein
MRQGCVPNHQWHGFFDEFSRRHSGWKTAVEFVGPDSVRQRLVEGDSLVNAEDAWEMDSDKVGIRLKSGCGEDRDPIVVESVDSVSFVDHGPGMDAVVQLKRRGQPSVLVHVWQQAIPCEM